MHIYALRSFLPFTLPDSSQNSRQAVCSGPASVSSRLPPRQLTTSLFLRISLPSSTQTSPVKGSRLPPPNEEETKQGTKLGECRYTRKQTDLQGNYAYGALFAKVELVGYVGQNVQ